MPDLMTILFGTALTGRLRRRSAASPDAVAGPEEEESWIASLCRQTGKWVVIGFDGQDTSTVRTTSRELPYPILVRTGGQSSYSTRFQCYLPIRFSLEHPPSGLFARLLMRSRDIPWTSWTLDISNACETDLFLTAVVPNVAIDAWLFNEICQEMTTEVAAFHKELRDKFNYAGGFSPAPTRQTGPDVPMVRPGHPPRQLPQEGSRR